MPIDQRRLEKSLPKKGFVLEEAAKHRYFHHEYEGRRTGVSTFVSRGSAHKTIDDSLVASIKRQLKLDTSKQVQALVDCPMSGDDYNAHLREKGFVPNIQNPPEKPRGKR